MFRRTTRAPRLDPVRWRVPGRTHTVRLVLVAGLLTTAAALGYARDPQTCPPSAARDGLPAAAGGPSSAGGGPSPATSGQREGAAPSAVAAVPPGRVGVPVRLADPAALTMVRPGDRVDLIPVRDSTAQPVATAALVLGVGDPDDPAGGLFLALDPGAARRIVGTAPAAGFAVVVRPGGQAP